MERSPYEEDDIHIDEEKAISTGIKQPLLSTITNSSTPNKGGLTTLPFILANAGFEGATSTGLMQNMILYLVGVCGLEMATGSNIIYLWSATTYFSIILCAFLADAFVGRFWVIGFGSILNLMGMMLLWLTTIIPGAGPSCDDTTTNTCTSSTPFQLLILCFSLWLMSLGSGGIRSSTVAFGVDQLGNVGEEGTTTPSPSKVVERFLNWYYVSFAVACLFGLTCLVYIQDHFGWKVGFGVTFCFMFLATICFFLPSSFYAKAKPKSSLLVGFAQVLVASLKNRHYMFPCHQETNETIQYHVAKGSMLETPSQKLRFLNKACIVKDPRQELTPEGSAANPWHLCTTDQVEELKSVLRVIPLWSTGIIYGACVSQASVLVLQANSMDRHVLSSSFEIPAGSFHTFSLITIILWLVLYDRVILPLASKAQGKPISLHVKTRMGTGLLLSILALMVAAVVESVRQGRATEAGELTDNTLSKMSALWLLPQLCLLGLGECMLAVAQIELYYCDLPKSMSSISSNLAGLSMTIASLVASLIMTLVDYITKRGGRRSWVSGDVNNGHYDYYYCVLAGLSVLNYMYFLVCSWAYWGGRKDSQDTN